MGARLHAGLVFAALLASVGMGIPTAGRAVQLAYFYKPPLDGTSPRFIAQHYSLIVLTQGDERYAAALRRAGYRGPILQYVAADVAEGPGPYADAQVPCDTRFVPFQRTFADRVGLFCGAIDRHENWFLHNRAGRRLYILHRSADGVERVNYAINPASTGWRQFAAAQLRRYRRLGYNGFFLDNIDLSRAGLLRQSADAGGVEEFATDAAYRAAVAGYLEVLRRAVPGVPLWANLTDDPDVPNGWHLYLPYLDGIMVEDFAWGWIGAPLGDARRAAQMENIRAALSRGKSLLLVAQGQRGDTARLRRSLALYRSLANDRVFFRYADAGDRDYRTVWWYAAHAEAPPQPAPVQSR